MWLWRPSEGRARALHKSLLLEAREDAARDSRGRARGRGRARSPQARSGAPARRAPGLRQRERPAERRVVEHADPLRVEAVEGANCSGVAGDLRIALTPQSIAKIR